MLFRSVLRVRGAAVRGLVYVDGVDSPNHLIRDHLGDLDGVREQDLIVVGSPGTLGPGMKATIIGNEGGRGGGGRRGQKSAP